MPKRNKKELLGGHSIHKPPCSLIGSGAFEGGFYASTPTRFTFPGIFVFEVNLSLLMTTSHALLLVYIPGVSLS